MKVGIITYHCAHNYGATLQAYALKQTIAKLGHEVSVIDFRPDFLTELYSLNVLNTNIRKVLSTLFMFPVRYRRYRRFEEFIKANLNLTTTCYTNVQQLRDTPPMFDAYICGSDQIWNPQIAGVVSSYFLDFAPAARISYAASFGSKRVSRSYYKELRKYMNRIQYISVREKDAITIVKDIVGRDAQQVLDPVFLLSRSEWERVEGKSRIREPYILLYMMEPNFLLLELAKTLAAATNMKIINISTSVKRPRGVSRNIRDAGPEEFIGLMKSASYVCTNSFHGTAFSIIFGKPFIVVPHSRFNSRIESILDKLDLNQKMVRSIPSSHDALLQMLQYDSKACFKLLKREKDLSLEFLETALNGCLPA